MRLRTILMASAALFAAGTATAQQATPGGRLFHAPLDTDYAADQAAGEAWPLFVENVEIVADGANGPALRAARTGGGTPIS